MKLVCIIVFADYATVTAVSIALPLTT